MKKKKIEIIPEGFPLAINVSSTFDNWDDRPQFVIGSLGKEKSALKKYIHVTDNSKERILTVTALQPFLDR